MYTELMDVLHLCKEHRRHRHGMRQCLAAHARHAHKGRHR
jgi:hypothetical protein